MPIGTHRVNRQFLVFTSGDVNGCVRALCERCVIIQKLTMRCDGNYIRIKPDASAEELRRDFKVTPIEQGQQNNHMVYLNGCNVVWEVD